MVWEMRNWPDPDNAGMSYLIDQWLVFLRKEGLNGRQLERGGRALTLGNQVAGTFHHPSLCP